VEAGELRVGDVLLLRSGERAPVTRLEVRWAAVPVYNLHVEGLHCYAVGRQGVLVHNKAAVELLRGALSKAGLGASKGFIGCFGAGTPLLTPTGDKRVDDLRPGDWVLAAPEFDPGAPPEPKLVEDVFVGRSPLVNLHVGSRVVRVTAQHPFFVQGRGWAAAGSLKAGDLLRSHDGRWVAVEGLTDSPLDEVVHNLRVAEHHTYFVGERGWGFSVWSHNNPCSAAGKAGKQLPPGQTADQFCRRQIKRRKMALDPCPTGKNQAHLGIQRPRESSFTWVAFRGTYFSTVGRDNRRPPGRGAGPRTVPASAVPRRWRHHGPPRRRPGAPPDGDGLGSRDRPAAFGLLALCKKNRGPTATCRWKPLLGGGCRP
jgi:hypothetical protein